MLANKKNRRENERKVGNVADGFLRGICIATFVSLLLDIGILIYLITKVGIFG